MACQLFQAGIDPGHPAIGAKQHDAAQHLPEYAGQSGLQGSKFQAEVDLTLHPAGHVFQGETVLL